MDEIGFVKGKYSRIKKHTIDFYPDDGLARNSVQILAQLGPHDLELDNSLPATLSRAYGDLNLILNKGFEAGSIVERVVIHGGESPTKTREDLKLPENPEIEFRLLDNRRVKFHWYDLGGTSESKLSKLDQEIFWQRLLDKQRVSLPKLPYNHRGPAYFYLDAGGNEIHRLQTASLNLDGSHFEFKNKITANTGYKGVMLRNEPEDLISDDNFERNISENYLL
jgi:hypothetical protein